MGSLVDVYNLAKFANRHPLAQQRKRRTIERFIRWQIASRTIRHPIVLPFVGDTRIIISKQMPGAAVNYYFGLPEVEEVALALHFLREGELLGDIGANIGALSIAAAGVARARVIAMEPVPSTYQALCDNIAINRLADRVAAHQQGASDKNGSLQFSTDRGGSDHVVSEGCGQQVPVRPLDDVFDEAPAMLVLDVEGFEPAVVQGAQRLLSRPELKVVIIETLGLAAGFGLDEDAMHRTMLNLGFGTFKYFPRERRLQKTAGKDAFNTIYIRDAAEVESRVRAARPFRVDDQQI